MPDPISPHPPSRSRSRRLVCSWLLTGCTTLGFGCYEGAPSLDAADTDPASTGQASGGTEGAGPADASGGGSSGEENETSPPGDCDGSGPLSSPRALRRLTPREYRATLADLVGVADVDATYDGTAAVLGIREVRQLRDDAEALVDRVDEWTPGLVPCDPTGPEDAACAAGTIAALAPVVFRRPLSTEEEAWLTAVYDEARVTMGFSDAMDVLLETILQSPALIYFEERGESFDGSADTMRRLNSPELATRLSYFLLGAPPDAELRAAASEGRLQTDAELTAALERLREDPRAGERLTGSVWSALQLDGGQSHFPLFDADKRADLYPDYGLGLQFSMQFAFEAFVGSIIDGGGTFDELLTSRRAYVDDRMASLYGVAAPPAGQDWHWVDLPQDERAGVLTRAAFLTVYANTATQSPIRRGAITLSEVLCLDLGEPPPNVDDSPIEGGDNGSGVQSVREATEARTGEGTCAACHRIINPVGYAFEHYDAVGAWQDSEALSGQPIDASAQLLGSDIDGPVNGAVELSAKLAASPSARSCFAERWLSEAVGTLGELDACSRDRVVGTFVETGRIDDLLTAVVLSDSFRFINTAPVTAGE